MKDLLVGSTGFLGGNLTHSHSFENVCHSSDVAEYYGSRPELCVYSGVPAAMYLANTDPESDYKIMEQARENIRRINAKKTVLISTVAVFSDSRGKYEDSPVPSEALPAYGKNRLQLEQWVREDLPDALIIRLPALYGADLKKNFLFDLHTVTPAMLTEEKYRQIGAESALVRDSYVPGKNGFFTLSDNCDRAELRRFFTGYSFNALCFTDSRSRYQFYPLARLWNDISAALDARLTLLHLCTPPVSASEVYEAVTGKNDWHNEISGKAPFSYDMRSCHSRLLGGAEDYLCTKEAELADIVRFMNEWARQE